MPSPFDVRTQTLQSQKYTNSLLREILKDDFPEYLVSVPLHSVRELEWISRVCEKRHFVGETKFSKVRTTLVCYGTLRSELTFQNFYQTLLLFPLHLGFELATLQGVVLPTEERERECVRVFASQCVCVCESSRA